MNDTNKDDAPRSPTTPIPPRSGSDTASAANISAGTSVGNAGQPATPYGQQGAAGSGTPGSSSSSSYGQQGEAGSSTPGSSSSSSYGQQGGAGSGTPGSGSSSSYGQQAGSGSGNQGSGSSYGRQGTTGSGSRGSDWERSSATRQAGGAAGSDQPEGAMDRASEWTREQYREGARQLYQARNSSLKQFRSASGSVERFVTENPLMVGVMGLAAGLVIGALLPRTRQEDRAFGRWADEVRQQGMRYARDATQRGREYVEEALGGADSDEDDWRPGDDNRGGIRSAGPRYQNH